ncbi:MAG TPA: c-type cytochrome [Gemmatimonadaceae bacterium]|nr:c-type cytochrome [Gemmatimonadaceae bacterium]
MAGRSGFAILGGLVAILSCMRAPATPTPARGSAPAAAPAAQAQPSAPGGIVTLTPRRIPPSRDSLAKLRANYIAQVMHDIAGREKEPAAQVFKNVQVLKDLTAEELIHKMDKDYATALGWSCTNCHRLANQGNWASDTSADKRRARFMQQMQNDINTSELPKLYPKDTPKVTCATCHRGYNEPPSAEYLLPERGKPGGLPFPPPRGNPPAPPAGERPPGARPPL